MRHTWYWQTATEHPYLATTLLKHWPHGFFTRMSWPETPMGLSKHLDEDATVYRVKQVHGKQIVNPGDFPLKELEDAEQCPEADAVMSIAPQQAMWVCTADCTPVLIADIQTGQVASIHAGWRGTALGIVPETMRLMEQQGSCLEDLRVAMGPAIAGEVYQVSTQVAAEVGRSLYPDAPIAEGAHEEIIAALQGMENPAVLPDSEPGRVRLDVRRINELQLLQRGLDADQIAIAPHCTYQEPDRFFSYRRTKEKKVQWSGIVSA